ncbi:MAG: MmgE/PrpD family protein [Paracoccaceae bacterium]|nr:MmgE/PrpD family protein [Paracoccaceae bacterium]
MTHAPPATSLFEVAARALWAKPRNAQARQLARDAIIDTLGCIVAGRDEAVVAAVTSAHQASGLPSGPCRVVGGLSAPPFAAARINGTAAHALDFDDNFEAGMSHASAVLVPALLAVAQAGGKTPAQVVDSYLVGLQAQAEVGRALGYGHYIAGWHATSTVGCIGTACGVAHLLALCPDGIEQAMSIAVSFASGTKGQFGTPTKPFHAGLAAGNAVEAAYLAQAGLTGRSDILERPQGLLEMFAGAKGTPPSTPDPNEQPSGPRHAILSPGLAPKRFACCGSTHLAIDALLDLVAVHGFGPEQVKKIEILVGQANYRNLPYSCPQDGHEARFSMHYCLTQALRSGTVSLSDFAHDTVAARRTDPLLRVIDMAHRSAEEEAASSDRLAHVVEVTLTDGAVLRGERQRAKGTLSDPFTCEDKRAKLAQCTAHMQECAPDFDALHHCFVGGDLRDIDPLFG